MDEGNIIDILTLNYSQICYEQNLKNKKIIFSTPFYVHLCKLRIAKTVVMQPSL